MYEWSSFSIFLPAFGVVNIIYFSHSLERVYLNMVGICISLIVMRLNIFLCVYIPPYIFFHDISIQIFSPF